MRSYRQFCTLAHALDLVGERWALLVVRELLLGPKRFTDLRAGMPGIPTNVLSARLRELEQASVVRRRTLPPPTVVTVYELTDEGRGLEEAMLALGRWGARTMGQPGPDRSLRSGWLGVACKAFTDREAASGLHATCEFRLDDGAFHARIADGDVQLADGGATNPDLVLATSNFGLLGLLTGAVDAGDALAAGTLSVTGDQALLPDVVRVFRLPLPDA